MPLNCLYPVWLPDSPSAGILFLNQHPGYGSLRTELYSIECRDVAAQRLHDKRSHSISNISAVRQVLLLVAIGLLFRYIELIDSPINDL